MKKLILITILILLLTGCSGVPPAATQVPTPVPTDAPAVEPVEEETPVVEEPTQEVIEEPEATSTPVVPESKGAVCVPPASHPDLAYTSYQEFPQAILDYLNAGASPEELAVTLIINGLGPNEHPVWAEDLTGDGTREVAVTVFDESQPSQGAMLIFNCADGQYQMNHIVVSDQDGQAPKLLYIQDFNADGMNDVVFSSTHCGAHTCFEDLNILSWNGGEYVNKLEGSTLEYPYPDIKLTDFDHDGIYDLEVTGTVIASVGAGPQRNSINVWSYNPATTTWILSDQFFANSDFRIHQLHDAEDAMDRGEYQIASLLFQQVIDDDNLLDWANPESERAYLSAYSYFKRIVAAAFMGDRATAESLYQELDELYGVSDQYAYVDLAYAFLVDSETLGLEGGCTSAIQYARTNKAVILDPISSTVFGYANRDFEPEDVCP
ncbi:MAG: hypothetical protein ACK2T7_08490 [Anaerolineales bacterium]